MDEIELQKERLKRKHQNTKNYGSPKKKIPNEKYWKNALTRVLIAVIFVLSSTIFISWSNINKENYKKNVFETNLSFTTINNWYEKYFGSALPIDFNPGIVPVSQNQMDISNVIKYQNGFLATVSKDSAITSWNSGIVVFIGEKENYGNVLIVQGIDGVDIWYGNITNINLNLYDYVEKGSIIGSALEDHIYFVFQKDGQYLDYEEYKNQI